MSGMPGMFGMQGMGGGGMMPHDARLADEFMKLQQDFFKWQQQLLQNQHVLHSRVAPLASNPPQLQSVGVGTDALTVSLPLPALLLTSFVLRVYPFVLGIPLLEFSGRNLT